MPTRGRVLSGKKVAKNHTTLFPESCHVITAAIKLSEVKKVIPGPLLPLRSGPPRLKFKPVNAGLQIEVTGGDGTQIIYVYTNDPNGTQRELSKKWH